MMLLCWPARCLAPCAQSVQPLRAGSGWKRGFGIRCQQESASVVARSKVEDTVCHDFGMDARQSEQVSVYVDALLDWNQRMNLTAVTDRDGVMERHIEDSLALLPVLETLPYFRTLKEPLKVVDVGTGAGLPGIVFAIARPAWQVTLLESLQKRCNFLEFAVDKTGLSNVQVVRARAEDCGREKGHREAYDVAVARAVAEMRVLSELCLPFVRVGGIFIAAKGANPEEEVESAKGAITLLGASLKSISRVASTGPLGLRTAVVCQKWKSTPAKYPRSPGTPSKVPLQ